MIIWLRHFNDTIKLIVIELIIKHFSVDTEIWAIVEILIG